MAGIDPQWARIIAELTVGVGFLTGLLQQNRKIKAQEKKMTLSQKKNTDELYSSLVQENQEMMAGMLNTQREQHEAWKLTQTAEIESLRQEVVSLRREIAELHQDLNAKMKIIAERDIEIKIRDAEIAELKEEIREKEEQIALLEQTIANNGY